MSNHFKGKRQQKRRSQSLILATLLSSISLINQGWFSKTEAAQKTIYCKFPEEAIAQKENLRQRALKENLNTHKGYRAILKQHAERLRQCRSQTWPRIQAVWLRLYPCDARPGAIDDILDRIVNLGYNQVNLEVFFDGQVLLPVAENPTAWPSALRTPGNEKTDVLAQVIEKGHARGLRVYAWMFTMHFGYSYAQRADRQSALALNGKGQTSLSVVQDGAQLFIDPYNRQAQIDYYQMVEQIVRRKPDGVLFDYIRYPRQTGSASIATKVTDLWVYSEASQQALYQRALNNKGLELIRRFLGKGHITAKDIEAVDRLYPLEQSPLWQGRTPPPDELKATASQRQPLLQWELWQLSVAHAAQGVVDFLQIAAIPAKRQGIPAGAVFFPDGNQAIGRGYDSRIQPWDRFTNLTEWHPMSYANCGEPSCITAQIKRVLSMAKSGIEITPVIAGAWGKSFNDRPSLEVQMQAIRQAAPEINFVSHFAYSWQEPEFDRDRKACRN